MPTKTRFFRPRHVALPPSNDTVRGSSSSRGYDAQWRRLRREHLTANPLCFNCNGYATLVDHKVPVAVDPSRRLDPTNLRSACGTCHGEITARFKREGINEPQEKR